MSDHQEGPSTFVNASMMIILTTGTVVGLWFLLRAPIMWVSFYLSYYAFTLYQHLPFLMTDAELQAIMTARQFIPRLKPTDYGIESLMRLFEYHGYVWRWVWIPGLAYWGWKINKGTVRFKFRRNIKDVYDLIDIQSKHFPASAIIKGKNLLKTHPYVGPWATYALPLDFALDNKLLWVSKTPVELDRPIDKNKMLPFPPFKADQKIQPFPVKRKLLPHYRYMAMDVDAAHELFKAQTGELWKGVDHLPPLEKALYAVFLAQGNGKASEAWDLLKQLAFTFKEGVRDKQGRLTTPHTANTNGVDEMIAKYGKHPKAIEITERHAHKINVLAATLVWARSKGRLMHSNFLWLKPVNRTLWYALCGQGGQCPYWEAAGPWAHAQVESLVGRKLPTPMVLGAVEDMRRILSVEHWIDPGEHSAEAQQKLVTEANAMLEAGSKNNAKPPRGARQGTSVQVPARQPTPARNKPEDDAP